MTSNEVAYWQLQEQKRSNLVKEGQNEEAIRENIRANKAKENLTAWSNANQSVKTGVDIIGGIMNPIAGLFKVLTSK